MEPSQPPNSDLLVENRRLREQLMEAQDTLRAIQNGEVDALVVTTNIGEQVFTLQGADHTYRLLVESMNEGAVTLSENGVVLFCNSRFAKMIGTPLNSITGTEFTCYISPFQLDNYYAFIHKGMLENNKEEFQLRTEFGELPVSLSINMLVFETPIVCLIVTDLTESKRSFLSLQNEKKRLQELAQIEHELRLFSEGLSQASRALVSTLNADELFDQILLQISTVIPLDFVYISLREEDAFRVVRQFNPNPSRKLPDLIDERFTETEYPLRNKILETGSPISLNDLANRSDWVVMPGWEWAAQFVCVPLVSKEQVLGSLNFYSDQPGKITSTHIHLIEAFASQAVLAIQNARMFTNLETSLKTEKLLRAQMIQTEKFTALGRMVASITHELTSPLQTIKNCLYLTKRELEGNGEHELLKLASEEVQRLTNLVGQLREIYRPRPASQDERIELCELLDEIQSLVAYELRGCAVEWTLKPWQGDFQVKGARDQIKQVFLNIVWNALQAMKPKPGALIIELLRDPDHHLVGVAIQDTGPGIAPEHISRLFEPLFTTKSTGVGLGLSISMNIVHSYGGRIDVESELNQGAKFTVWLPEAVLPK